MGRRNRERKERIIAGLEEPRGMTEEQKKKRDELKRKTRMIWRKEKDGREVSETEESE